MPLPSVKSGALQCTAKSKRSGQRCLNPAAYGCKTCRFHGAHRGRTSVACESHWNYQHGQSTKKKRAQNAAATAKLNYLRDLGNLLGMFTGKTGWPGRKPNAYRPPVNPDPLELVGLIEALDTGRSPTKP